MTWPRVRPDDAVTTLEVRPTTTDVPATDLDLSTGGLGVATAANDLPTGDLGAATPADDLPADLRPRRARHRPGGPRPTWRWRLARRDAVIAGVALAVVAAVVVGGAAARAPLPGDTRPTAQPLPTPNPPGGPATAAPGGTRPGAAPTDTASPPGVVVHVVGQVLRPGLVRLPAGARVADAVDAAGGAAATADLSMVNLARVLVDGEQIVVPLPGQAAAGPGPPAAAGAAGSSAPPGTGAVVDLNAADLGQLDALPGIGPVLAQRILDWRTEHGRFTSVDELAEVRGIGPAALARLDGLVRV